MCLRLRREEHQDEDPAETRALEAQKKDGRLMSVFVPKSKPEPPTRAELQRQRQVARERFMKARIAEREYARQLFAVGRNVGHIVNGFTTHGVVDDFEAMKTALSAYSRLLEPWAEAVTKKMQADVNRRDLRAWKQLSQSIGRGLELEIGKTPVGDIQRELLAGQIRLIKSIPLDAALRVQEFTLKALVSGERADEIAKEIMRSGKVSANHALMIALTETSRTASSITEARATYIGWPYYRWHSSGDAAVRPEHRILNGTIQRWDSPPIASGKGQKIVRAHPGCWVRCRCWPEPLPNDAG
jgi:SPP1 gp7 family putative phage head morphogenesis protein